MLCRAVTLFASVLRPGLPIDNMCTSFSAMGSAVILPLDPAKGYEFEVAIFGGGTQVRLYCLQTTVQLKPASSVRAETPCGFACCCACMCASYQASGSQSGDSGARDNETCARLGT